MGSAFGEMLRAVGIEMQREGFVLPDEMKRPHWTFRRMYAALGLDAEKFTVFLNAGWEGGGNVPEIFRELVRGELDVQAIFLAGKNEALKNEAETMPEAAR